MAKLGAPVSKKFSIGTAELRLSAMTSANMQTQSHSVGLVDSVTVNVAQNSVDLKGGFPKFLADTAIVEQTATVSAVLREYSRKNINLLLGEGVQTATLTDVSTTLASNASQGASSITLTSASGLAVGDVLVIYTANSPESTTLMQIGSIATNTITFKTGQTLPQAYTSATAVVYKAHQIAIGNVQETQYFSAMILQQSRDSDRPMGFSFWKCAISSGMDYATNSNDFASANLQLKVLTPAAEDYAVSAPLNHVADLIANHPFGLFWQGNS